MKEITYIHAEGCAAGELKHGPFSLLTPKTPVVAVCTKDDAYPVMISNIKEMKARGAPVIAIGSGGDADLKEIADIFIPLPRSKNICEVISATIILQMIAYNTAVHDVQFGINCSVNAGSWIGSRVKAAPNSYLSGKINDDTVLGR